MIAEEAARSLIAAWESFYVIVGSSAAALTGLQFVVIALGAEAEARTTGSEIRTFATPTIVHFCAVLLISAILSAPWPTLTGPSTGLGVSGIAGIAYAAIIVSRARRQTTYRPVMADWLWHTAIPFLTYSALLAAAVLLPEHPRASLFGIGAAALVLLFTGIHNAWDAVTYIAVERRLQSPKEPAE